MVEDFETAGFEYGCTEELVINRSKERVFDALYKMDAWPQHLPHVKAIEVLYNDGQYQEFLMHVDSNGMPIKVRSVRNCRLNSTIEFFQPEPPVFLRHHAGGWEFHALGLDACRVVAHHRWNLKPEVAEEKFPATSEQTTEQRVEHTLRDHSRLALTTWKNVLEQEVLQHAEVN